LLFVLIKRVLRGHKGDVNKVSVISPNSLIASCSDDGTAKVNLFIDATHDNQTFYSIFKYHPNIHVNFLLFWIFDDQIWDVSCLNNPNQQSTVSTILNFDSMEEKQQSISKTTPFLTLDLRFKI